jgi:dephospho-CoA kinase
MKTIGLVGGVASGKSLVARMLVELGAGLLDADRTGHSLLADDPDVQQALRQRWGAKVFSSDGSVDRAAVASRVFGPNHSADAELQFLQQLLHPRIGRRLAELGRQFDEAGTPAVVLDAPLLLEAGWKPFCDIVLMIDVPREVRLQRAKHRGWTEEEFDRREAAQVSVEEKRRLADVIISNTGTEDELRQVVRAFWNVHVQAANSPG